MSETKKNTIEDLIRFFTSGKKPMTHNEFLDFWGSLSKEELEDLRTMDLNLW